MHIDSFGSEQNPTIVLFHGSGAPAESLKDLADALSQTHHVLLPHFPGYGKTPADETYDFQGSIDTLAGLLTPYKKLIFIGHSFGLYRATRLLELCEDQVNAMIGLGGIASLPDEAYGDYEAAAQWAKQEQMIAEGLIARWFLPQYAQANASLVQHIAQWWQQCDTQTVCAELFVPIDQGKHLNILQQTTTPVYLFHGAQDMAAPIELAHQIDTLGEHIQLTIIEDQAHMLHMEQKEHTLSMLRTLLAKI